ncbi:MAG: hypothetical protein KDA96_00940 [Planctomycetaceae bacterium]|nr:hypothetical protein [Planctomycetaceae bacterium]
MGSKNTASNTVAFVGAVGVEEILKNSGKAAAGKIGGILVQPAVWVVTGSTPDAADGFLYGVGVVSTIVGSTIGGVAAGVTGIVKGLVDDETDRQLEGVRLQEPQKYRQFIQATVRYSSFAGQTINAMTIASKGGTAWRHKNGLWVYVTDAKGRLICNYQPKSSIEIYQPILPLERSGDGFKWRAR